MRLGVCLQSPSQGQARRCFAHLLTLVVMLALPQPAPAVEGEDPGRVGVVTKVQNEAQIVWAAQAIAAIIGAAVHLNDELRTGADGRLQVTLRDGTVLRPPGLPKRSRAP
jgi:hypothetical protein